MKNRIFRGAGVALAVAFLMTGVAAAAAADGDMPEALGVYEVRVNGVRPGDADEILRPGFTTCRASSASSRSVALTARRCGS